MDDNVKKFQDFLGAAEGAGYDTIVGGKQKITDYSKHPGIIGLRTAEGPSTAAGKYQITKTTYDDFAPKLGITDFSPESQDRIAMAIIEAEGAGDDVRNGNWTSAVNKLGGRWASLPSSKYKQPKRDAQFVQKHLGDYADTPASKFDQNTPGAISPSYGASQKDMLIADAQRDAKYGGVVNQIKALPEAVSLGFQNENSVYNFFRDQGMQNYDPEFSWSEEMATEILTGIPRDNRDYILQAGSRAEAMTRRGRVMEALENQKQLGEMGLAGVAGTLTGSLVDLPTLVGFLPVVGGTAMVSRTSRLANALASGFAGAASNVAVDAATMKYRPLGTPDELYFSAAAGLGFGALFGGISKPAGRLAMEVQELADVGKREYHRLAKDEIHGAGYEVTPKGAAAFKDPTPQGRADAAELDALRAERQQTPQAPRESAADIPGTRSSSRATLKSLADEAEDPEVRRLAARLGDQMGEDVPIHPTTKESPGGGSRPFYDAKRHAIFVPENVTEKQALHEIAHAATVSRIDYGRANPQSSHGRIVSELEEAFQGARQAAANETFKDPATKHYLKDLQEFVAGLYSGKSEFTDFLAKVKPTGATESLLGRVFNAARKLLGLPVDDANALSKSMGLTDKLIETPAPLHAADDGLEGIHFAPMDGATVDPQVVQAANTARLPDIFGWSFGLEHKLRKVKDLPKAFALADKLLGTTVGYKDHGVVKRNAWDQTIQLGDGWATNVKKTATVQFEDYVKRSGRKWWERGNLAKEWNTQLGDYIRGVDGEYDKTVIATGDQIRKTLGDVVDHINNPAKQTGGTKKGLTQDTYLDEQGNELLTDALPKNENYLPRANDAQKWSQMVQQFGRGFVQDFWSGAFKAANVDASDEIAKRFGKWYVERVESAKVNRDGDFLTEQLRGYDKEALKESMVRSGMSDPEAQDVLDTMFPKDHTGSKGLTANTKKRSSIDETYSVDVMVNGEAHKVSINDFINTDTMGVLDGYFRRMAGAISLANHTDIYKQSDVGKAILDATTVELGSTIPTAHLRQLRKDFQFTIDRLLHEQLEDFSTWNKGLAMWRNFNVIRLMGAAVYNQIQEMSQIIGTMGWKATLGAIPELGDMVRSAKTGKLANPILDQIENMTGGAGSDLVMRADFNPSDDWVYELGDTAFNRWLDRADNLSRKGANGVLKHTGMTGLMVQQKRIHAIALVNHFVDAAVDGKKLDFSPERLAWMGLSEGDTKKVLDGLKKFYRESTGETGKKVKNVDFEGWKAEDPEGLSKFITATQRESRRVVQENDLGASIPTMGYGWAKTMFQFQNFVMQAWNKSMLFAMNHRDFQTFSTMMYGAFFAGIVYVARTQQQMLGMGDEERQKFADKRLSTKQIVANSFGRTAQASLLPGMIDQVSPVPIFSGMRTTSDTTDFLSSNPTAQGVSTLFAAFRKGVRNGLSDDYQYTQQDMRSYLRMVPFNNVIGVSGLLNSLASDMPTSEEAAPQ